MKDGAAHLNKVLRSLVDKGEVNQSQADLISREFEALEGTSSRRGVIAEVAAYLGGAFTFIALVLIASKTWENFSSLVKFSLLAVLSVLLAGIGLWINGRTPMLMRLTSVLMMGSAISATASVAIAYESNEAPWLAFLAGCTIATFGFIRFRNELLHIGSYGYLFLTGFMILGKVLDKDPNESALFPIWWLILGTIWLLLAHKKLVATTLGYVLGTATLFIGTQFLFVSDHRALSYLVGILATLLLVRTFLLDHRWPLLVGAVALTTFTVGEFVAATLGGSLGAILGLLAAGIALSVTSFIAIKKAK